MKNILVTGGSGFLGSYIIDQLKQEGFNPISFSRNQSEKLKVKNIEQRLGDLSNYADIKNALTDIDAVIHTASKVGMHGTFDEFFRSNVTGTMNLIKAMKDSKINKLVYTSTPSVVFGKDDIILGDESLPYPNYFLTHYAHSKKIAEEFVINSCNENFHAISLRPHLIFGPGDLNLIPRMIEARKKNRIKIVGDGKNLVDIIYVENAAIAHLNALKKVGPNLSKKCYFIGQGPVNLWTFTNEVLKHYNLPAINQKVSLNLAYSIGLIIELFLNFFQLNHIHPPMSRFIALQLGKSHYFSHKNAKADLGDYEKVTIQQGIKNLN